MGDKDRPPTMAEKQTGTPEGKRVRTKKKMTSMNTGIERRGC